MRRTFLINLALVLVLNLLVKPFYILGIDAEVQVRVGTSAYGSYYALLSLSFLLNMLLDLGITNWNTRHIAANTGEMREHIRGIVPLRALLALGYGAVLLVVGVVLGYHRHDLMLLAILALNQVLAATVLYLRSNLSGAQRYKQDSLLSVMDRVMLIGMAGYVLWWKNGGMAISVEHFAWMQTIAYGCTALAAWVLIARIGGAAWPRFDAVFARSVLKESFPYALLVLLMSFYYRTDTVMLERLLPDGAEQAGIYAQGFRFFEAFNMLGFLLAGLLLPMFSRMLAAREEVSPLAMLATRLVLAGALAVAIMGSVYASEVMQLRYHEHLATAAPAAFAILLWSFVAICLTYVHGTLLTASGDLRTLNKLAAGGMLLNLALNLVLIPRYQALGAAWAGFITQALMAVAQMLLTGRRFGAGLPLHIALRGIVYGLLLAGTAWGTRAAGLSLFMAFATMGVTALVTAFLTGLFDLDQARKLLAGRAVR